MTISGNSTKHGFIIVAVMWILMALASLASVYASYVGTSAIALSVTDDRLQAEELVYASLALTAYQMSSLERRNQPARGGFRFRLAKADVIVRYFSERSRIDINAASKQMLAGLFVVLGANPQLAEQYADRIIGWRTKPKMDQADGEADLYRAAGLNYLPRGGPFNHIGELWLVAGLPPAMVERALNYVTVYSGKPDVDLLRAAPEVVAALPGMTPGKLNAFLDQRELSADPQLAVRALSIPQSAAGKGSGAIRVTTQITFDKGSRVENEAVILVGGNEDSFRVLSWRDKENAPEQRQSVR
jgi:general secretion pathway protein K